MLTWDLITGHDQIDADHSKLLSVINHFFDSSEDSRILLTGSILNYVNGHCALEVKLMVEFDYPQMEEHIVQHVELKRFVFDRISSILEMGIDEDKAKEAIETLRNHIITYDKPLVAWLNLKIKERRGLE